MCWQKAKKEYFIPLGKTQISVFMRKLRVFCVFKKIQKMQITPSKYYIGVTRA